MNICTLFRELKDGSNYFSFSQYSEDLTRAINNSGYQVVPSKFICLDITPNSGSTNYNTYIPQVLQNYYENACSIARDNNIGYGFHLHKLLDALKLVDSNVIDNIKCIEDINMFSSNSVDGTNYNEIYCYIQPTTTDSKYYISEEIEDSNSFECGEYINGYSGEASRYSEDIFGIQYNTIDDGDGIYNYNTYVYSEDNVLLGLTKNEDYNNLEDGSFNVNTIIVLYDVKSTTGDESTIYNDIPLGIYFTGPVVDGEIQNKIIKYINNGDIYGQGTSYGVRISNRVIASTNTTDTEVNVVDETIDGVSVYSSALDKMTEIASNAQASLESFNSNNTTLKEQLSLIYTNGTNVPYIKEVTTGDGVVNMWFVNGLCTNVLATGNNFTIKGTISESDNWPTEGVDGESWLDEVGNLYTYYPYSYTESDLDKYADSSSETPIWKWVGNLKGSIGNTGAKGYSLNILTTLDVEEGEDILSNIEKYVEDNDAVLSTNDAVYINYSNLYCYLFIYDGEEWGPVTNTEGEMTDFKGVQGLQGESGASIIPQTPLYTSTTSFKTGLSSNEAYTPSKETIGYAYSIDGDLYVCGIIYKDTYTDVDYIYYNGSGNSLASDYVPDFTSTDVLYAYINMGKWSGEDGAPGSDGGVFVPYISDGVDGDSTFTLSWVYNSSNDSTNPGSTIIQLPTGPKGDDGTSIEFITSENTISNIQGKLSEGETIYAIEYDGNNIKIYLVEKEGTPSLKDETYYGADYTSMIFANGVTSSPSTPTNATIEYDNDSGVFTENLNDSNWSKTPIINFTTPKLYASYGVYEFDYDTGDYSTATWGGPVEVFDIDGVAPKVHTSSDTTYGKATGNIYGHVKLSNSTSDGLGTGEGYATTPKALYNALTSANTYTDDSVDDIFRMYFDIIIRENSDLSKISEHDADITKPSTVAIIGVDEDESPIEYEYIESTLDIHPYITKIVGFRNPSFTDTSFNYNYSTIDELNTNGYTNITEEEYNNRCISNITSKVSNNSHVFNNMCNMENCTGINTTSDSYVYYNCNNLNNCVGERTDGENGTSGSNGASGTEGESIIVFMNCDNLSNCTCLCGKGGDGGNGGDMSIISDSITSGSISGGNGGDAGSTYGYYNCSDLFKCHAKCINGGKGGNGGGNINNIPETFSGEALGGTGGDGGSSYGYYNCNNITDCTYYGIAGNGGDGNGYILNVGGNGGNGGSSYGYYNCNNINMCNNINTCIGGNGGTGGTTSIGSVSTSGGNGGNGGNANNYCNCSNLSMCEGVNGTGGTGGAGGFGSSSSGESGSSNYGSDGDDGNRYVFSSCSYMDKCTGNNSVGSTLNFDNCTGVFMCINYPTSNTNNTTNPNTNYYSIDEDSTYLCDSSLNGGWNIGFTTSISISTT